MCVCGIPPLTISLGDAKNEKFMILEGLDHENGDELGQLGYGEDVSGIEL